MKRIVRWLLIGATIAILAACGKNEEPEVSTEPEEILPLEVALTVTEQVEVGETVKMEALVTQGDEKVEDADKVVFEVWEEGKKEDSVMMDSMNAKEGLYTAETTFDHDGLFHIQVHVDARGMHTMPKKEVTVGDGGHHGDAHDDQEGNHGHGHSNGFSMHFTKPEAVNVNEGQNLMVHLQMDNAPLEQARVRYEIWNGSNENKKEWVEAEESKAGEYVATHTFAEPGTFHVQIHVENEDGLHEHEDYKFEVK
ncbi:FixH family protein [Sporosarcina sp. 179-K 3D1 HS]|uniref:FixH family protein n=1 Tax=Sporosarcina sp. 179-K 3D1 HS TaxID=3232169 RepID=UPI0039A16C50